MLSVESHGESNSTQTSVVRPGETLQGARLLDWRFLLPDHVLGTVACGGQCGEPLVEALRAVADRVTVASSRHDWTSVPPASLDLLVLVRPTQRELAAALPALRAGGWIYCEIVRSRFGGPGGLTGLAGAQRAFLLAGLDDVAAYWHAPNFAICARIIPLQSAGAVRNTLRRHDGVRFGRLKSLVGRVAMACGVFGWLVPEGSVIGRRSWSGNSEAR